MLKNRQIQLYVKIMCRINNLSSILTCRAKNNTPSQQEVTTLLHHVNPVQSWSKRMEINQSA